MLKNASLDWLQTLADGTRVRLLRLLEREELAVSELCSVLQLPQSTVSRHLKVLAAGEWIANRRDGTNQLYRISLESWETPQSELWQWVRAQADTPTTSLDEQRLQTVLSQRSQGEVFFQSAAQQWDHLRTELFGQHLDTFVLAASLPHEGVVGELGCGSAPLSQLVSPYVQQVIAIDSSTAMLSAARKRLRELGNVRLVNNQLTELSLADDTLDVAWLVVVLPYLSDPVLVLTEAARVLKPRASLVIVDLLPHDRSSYRQELGHLRLGVQRTELEGWLEQAGLQLRAYHRLPPDPKSKGPALFAATAARCP
ncbi:ArsR/SmtB family transcription factor [Aureliella helgolandensis]|uniref:Putative methyltransferase YcgJ n=1 Tax=Aureliella helgolandensis TaxID=2527968 RepID=A0A518FZP6_9BACT|nr:metalloregulator ArsR/SmtB family transcription factor [Aureliella helgolandensis]QDV21823.1 putative methyltransferase YcgJ [Aureliella helgolandensis]